MIRESGSTSQNRMLQTLLATGLEAIRGHLELVPLPRHVILFDVGAPIDQLYFVNRGLVSRIKPMTDGRSVAVGAVGSEGMIGLFSLCGIKRAMWEYSIQVPGTAFRIDRGTFDGHVAQCDSSLVLLRGYTEVIIGALAQTAACNRLHSLRQRCCRWLLFAQDSAKSDSFQLTHESLALMLGVQRAGLSLAANSLQQAGLIRYRHGHLTILDRPRLEAESCECYATIRRQLDALLTIS
jgi:CRP-like cAMP-binding protein